MKALFSGRFDPPHPGHIAQILRLNKECEKVLVLVLDYPERYFPIEYVLKVFRECLPDEVEVNTNSTHFGEITREEWSNYQTYVWAGGNLQVLRHLESMNIPVKYVERAFEYSASKYERPNT